MMLIYLLIYLQFTLLYAGQTDFAASSPKYGCTSVRATLKKRTWMIQFPVKLLVFKNIFYYLEIWSRNLFQVLVTPIFNNLSCVLPTLVSANVYVKVMYEVRTFLFRWEESSVERLE